MSVELKILPSFIFNPPCAPRPKAMVDLYKRLGTKNIEWLSELATPEYITAFRNADLQIVSLVTGWIPFQNPMLGALDHEERKEALQWFYQRIDCARGIGATYLSGSFGFLEKRSKESSSNFLEALKSLVDYANAKVVLLIEKMRCPQYPGFTWDECREIAAELKQPCSILRDVGHMACNDLEEKKIDHWIRPLPEEQMQYWHVYEAYHKPIRQLDLSPFRKTLCASEIKQLVLAVELFYQKDNDIDKMYQEMQGSINYIKQSLSSN